MSDIFLSYAREDLQAARRLAAALEVQGWSVFWDLTIRTGARWREAIDAALKDARCVVVLWSPNSVKSHWVMEEADHGLKRRVLVPAFLESVEPPLGFRSIHAADLSTWAGNREDAGIQQFLSDLAGILGPAPVVPAEERSKAEAEAKRKSEEQRRQQAEAEAKRKSEEQRRQQAEVEAKRKVEEQRRQQAEVEAKHKAEEQRRQQAEVEAKHKAEEQRRQQAEAEAKRKAEEQRRQQAEAEAKRKAEEQQHRHRRGEGDDGAADPGSARHPAGAAARTEGRDMTFRSPAIHGDPTTTTRSSTIRSGGFYAGRRALSEAGFVLFGVVILIWTLLPLYHMVMLSLTPLSDSFAGRFWPDNPTLENYRIVFAEDHFFLQDFWRQLWNSIFVALATMVMVLVVASLASFAIGRLKLRYGHVISNTALLTYLIPAAFVAIPFYVVMSDYGLINTLWALIFAMSTFAIPYAIWVLRQYGDSVPFELDEAAKVDGATPIQIFYLVYLPLLRPAMIAIGTYALLLAWNEYLYAFLLLSTEKQHTIPVAMGYFLVTDDAPWSLLMATAVIYSLPPAALYYAVRKYMVSGLTAGATKA
jgi:multiple sugar transport system permease protein